MELKPGWPCFFCLNPVIFERQQNGPRERVPYSNLNRIFKYLKLPLPQQVKLEEEDGGLEKSTEEFIVPLCKVCLEVTGKLTGLCAELELIQMRIDYQLGLFRGRIAVKEEGALREDVEEEIRRRTRDRCSKLLKRCLPRVKLRRIVRGVKEDGLNLLKTDKTVDPLEIVQVDMDMSSFPINLQESGEDFGLRTEQRTNRESIGAVDKECDNDNRTLTECNSAETEVNNPDRDVTMTPPPPKIRIKVTKGYKFAITRVSGPRKRDRNRISRRIPLRTKLWGKGKHKLQNSLFKNDVDTQHYHYCPHCGTEFISKQLLQNHIEMHCTFVKKQEVQESRNKSSSSNTDTTPSLAIKNCDKCNTIFTCEKALKRHIHNCHPETYFMGWKHPDITMAQFETICEYQLSSERGLFKKMEVAQESGVQLLYECPYCSKSIDILQFVSSHLIENHHSLLASRIKIQVEKAVEIQTENHSVPKVAMVNPRNV